MQRQDSFAGSYHVAYGFEAPAGAWYGVLQGEQRPFQRFGKLSEGVRTTQLNGPIMKG